VSSYPADTEVPWFRSRVVCAKCGARNSEQSCVEKLFERMCGYRFALPGARRRGKVDAASIYQGVVM
jgi:hypothetical protein